MNDDMIKRILIEERRKERSMQRIEDTREWIEGALCWISWAALGYMLFWLTPMITG